MQRVMLAAATMAAAILIPCTLSAQEQQPEGAQVDSLEVTGNRRISTETILNSVAIPIRTPITYRDVQKGIRTLFALGQFDDVTIRQRTGAAGEAILVVEVKERPLVARVSTRGPDKVSASSVRDRIEVAPGRPLDPAHVARSLTRIDSLYEAHGYYLARVEPLILPQGDDSANVLVVFSVEEGRRIAISGVRIEGNEAFRDDEIVGRMQSRPEGFWWFQNGEYSDTKLREDVDSRIPDFYGSQGFIDFRVVKDTLLVDEQNGKAILQITVDEGRRYRVGSVTVDGNRFFTTDQVLTLNPFEMHGGSGLGCLLRRCADSSSSVFDQAAWDDATNKLRTQYANEGYIYAEVRSEVERIESPDSTIPGTVNLRWEINEMRPAIINRIDIVGNDVTHERIIREAIVILPGDVFAQDRIIRSYQNISNLGFFQQPMPFPDTKTANENGDIDLVFRVEEKHTGSINFGASMGQGTGVGGFLGLEEPNLFGRGKRGRLQWQFGRNINDFSLSYGDPSLFGGRISGTGEVHNSRLRYIVGNLGRVTRRGGSLQLGFPLPRARYSRLFVTGALDWEKYNAVNTTVNNFLYRCRECLRTQLGLQLMRDTRIDLPFPTGGSMHQVGVTFNGPFNTGTATFQRYDLEGRWYVPMARVGGGASQVGGIKLVLGLSTRAGFVVGNEGPFYTQLFAMGGTQYGIPLRGYDEFSITPFGYNPNSSSTQATQSSFGKSYFAMTGEFGVRLTPQVYTSLFYDAGNVWATAASFNPTRLFRGAGFGLALITPLGPLGLDLAYGFDRTNVLGRPEPGWKMHFKIGNFF